MKNGSVPENFFQDGGIKQISGFVPLNASMEVPAVLINTGLVVPPSNDQASSSDVVNQEGKPVK